MKLAGYILRNVGIRILAAILVLLGVLQILDLLEVTPDIVSRGLGASGMLHYALLRLPRLFDQAAPLGVLAGCIFAFMKLAGDSEVVAMRSTGVSSYRILAMAIPAALMIAVVDFAAVEFIAPRTDAALQTWWSSTAPPAPTTAPKPHAFRVGSDLAVAATNDYSGRTLRDVSIYRRDANGRLVERIKAASASYAHGQGWRLNNPQFVRFDLGEPQVGQAQQMTWAQSFEPADVQSLFFGDDTISAASARRALSGGGAQRPPSYYATRLQRAVATPVASLVMLLLALPVALASFRSSRGAVFVTGSLGAGLLFLVADGMISALGESGAISPILAAWTAPAVFSALAAAMLLRLEG
jgi:lipopolysaccharide export system permease protein